MSPPPFGRHQEIVTNFVYALVDFVRPLRLGKVYSAPCDVHLPSGDIVQPDVVFVATQNLRIVADWIRGAPELESLNKSFLYE